MFESCSITGGYCISVEHVDFFMILWATKVSPCLFDPTFIVSTCFNYHVHSHYASIVCRCMPFLLVKSTHLSHGETYFQCPHVIGRSICPSAKNGASNVQPALLNNNFCRWNLQLLLKKVRPRAPSLIAALSIFQFLGGDARQNERNPPER